MDIGGSGGGSGSGPRTNQGSDWQRLALYGMQIGATMFLALYVTPRLIDHITNRLEGQDRKEQKDPSVATKLQRDDLKDLTFTKHESIIAKDIVPRGSCEATFASVGGLEKEIRQIREGIIMPMRLWRLYQGTGKRKTLRYPSGMLLYGKPGTGKTMCVQALANELDASLICIKASTLLDKYIGESPKLVTGLFSLARKIAPTVVFIDEIDTLMRTRGVGGGGDGPGGLAMDGMQGAFLCEWDGLQGAVRDGEQQPPVVVVGATNRPNSLDKAILRRMPVAVQMPMPAAEARADILKKQTRGEDLAADLQWEPVVRATEGFSGSDIRELVRMAVLRRDQELVDAVMAADPDGTLSSDSPQMQELADRPLRALTNTDFEYAIAASSPTVDAATEFHSSVIADEVTERAKIAQRVRDKLGGDEDLGVPPNPADIALD